MIRIDINPKIYTPESIIKTIQFYKDCCTGSVISIEGRYHILLEPKGEVDENLLKLNFFNTCIGMIKWS